MGTLDNILRAVKNYECDVILCKNAETNTTEVFHSSIQNQIFMSMEASCSGIARKVGCDD